MSMALTNGNHNGAMQMMPDRETRDRLLAKAIMKGGTREQVELVVSICDMYGLEPLLKHLVLINGAPYITRDGLLHVAHRSGNFDGIEVEYHQAQNGEWSATCTVWRKNSQRPIRYTAFESEHKPKDASRSAWGQYPRAMLGKCAEVMALRRAFDVSLGAVEELGYDGYNPQSSIGQVVEITATEVVVEDCPAALPPPTPLKVEDWPDERLLAALGQGKPEPQVRRLMTVFLGRAIDKASLTERLLLVKGVADVFEEVDARAYKTILQEISLARADELGIPRKAPKQPEPPADDLTAVVGEPEADPQARRRALLWSTAAQYGWDEARVRSFGKSLYQSDDLTRWSAAQLDSFITFIRNDNSDQEGMGHNDSDRVLFFPVCRLPSVWLLLFSLRYSPVSRNADIRGSPDR